MPIIVRFIRIDWVARMTIAHWERIGEESVREQSCRAEDALQDKLQTEAMSSSNPDDEALKYDSGPV